MEPVKVGIIGGTGMQKLKMFEVTEEKEVETRYGSPSSTLVCGRLGGISCVLLSRHGKSHDIMPSNVNFRANIYALKEEGCNVILATTACGSLKEEFAPGHFVVIDQFIDRTTKRVSTFYDGKENSLNGVCHIPMSHPFCKKLQSIVLAACQECNVPHHDSGTVVVIEGPRFSTLAESNLYRSWGASVINMTTVPEVVLANELGLLYCSMAMVTDYDCWKTDHASVSVEDVMKVMAKNRENAMKVLISAVSSISKENFQDDIERAQQVSASSVM